MNVSPKASLEAKKVIKLFMLGIIIAVSLSLPVKSILANGTATLRVAPANLDIPTGGTGTSEVEVGSVSNLYGFDVRISFDPNVIQVEDADPVTEGVQVALGTLLEGRNHFVVRNEVDNIEGSIRLVISLLPPASAISTEGALLSITWHSQEEGQSTITLHDTILADPDGTAISHGVQNGTINVGQAPGPTPAPTATPPPNPTANPTQGVPVSGSVHLQSRNDHSGTEVYLSEYPCDQGTQTSPSSPIITTKASGHFEVSPYFGYTSRCLQVSHRGFLAAQAMEPEGDLGTITLIAGDVNQDDIINIFDLAWMAARYRTNDPTADFNQDGWVNIFDLSIAGGNFRQEGPTVW